MANEEKKALIQRHATAISTGIERRSSPVIARMTRDVLARAQTQTLSAARFRIGEYELREPDYRQILDWADELGLAPVKVLGCLANSRYQPYAWRSRQDRNPIYFELVDGAIRSLVWDFDELGLIPSRWRDGLVIRRLVFIGDWPVSTIALAPGLTPLEVLVCEGIKLMGLDLSSMPRLTLLYCSNNSLTRLNFSSVPRLTWLDCGRNSITELDLSQVPSLIELDCSANSLTKLDLSPVLALRELDCGGNELTELDLCPLPGLTRLICWGNKLTQLIISSEGLTELDCSSNPLTELDLSLAPQLNRLDCSDNPLLTELDLFSLPALTILHCSYNQFTELDLSPVAGLTELICDAGLRVFRAPKALKCAGAIIRDVDHWAVVAPAASDFYDDPF
ncbi:hypothetical protein U5801_04965 [Lamprobacter modestohalophilus]|uniref:leucine-rich repeat domain-containing protein n=1 Tax=Lamprobacter modestohalophilus TaxID=1064514 RepID=UPI002ADEF135|nr:hypothetical protein [Lamprobacter modestohalophilus]MEA1049160.1 hypothetical protein [Lamprobacter modestohalophilus]